MRSFLQTVLGLSAAAALLVAATSGPGETASAQSPPATETPYFTVTPYPPHTATPAPKPSLLRAYRVARGVRVVLDRPGTVNLRVVRVRPKRKVVVAGRSHFVKAHGATVPFRVRRRGRYRATVTVPDGLGWARVTFDIHP